MTKKLVKKKLDSLLIFILICIIVFQINTPVFAYKVFGYKLKGTWSNKYYYVSANSVTYNNTTVNYGNIATSAVSAWNNAVNSSSGHPLNIQLSKTTNGSSPDTRVVISPLDRGATGWRGFAYYYDYNPLTGAWSPINIGGYPNKNYQSGSALINLYYVHSDPTWKIQNTMMHEMGHIFGLMHTNVTGALMVESTTVYTSLKKPQSDDVSGVRSVYE